MPKKILLTPLIFLESLTDRIVAACGALISMQIPAFIVQYVQRLGGHVDELKILIGKYKAAAAYNGRTLDEYIQLHIESGVKEFASTGRLMTDNIDRFHNLSSTYQQISGAGGVKKFYLFIRNADQDIIIGTYRDYIPGISFSTDSIIYAVAGIIVFMSLYFMGKKCIILIYEKLSTGDKR